MEAKQAVEILRRKDHILTAACRADAEGSLLYGVLLRAIANDDELYEMALQAREGQPPALLLVSAVHYLVLERPQLPLAMYFRSVTDAPKPPEDVVPEFRAFCEAHWSAIQSLIRTRTVQTTSVDRAGALMLSMAEVAAHTGAPFSIVDIGCSAGLQTLFDHYAYDFGPAGRMGSADAPVVVHTTFHGKQPRLPQVMPAISARFGLDIDPLDPSDPDQMRWVMALSSPDQVESGQQLRSALEYRAGTPFDIVKGDALATLPNVLLSIDGPLCVFHGHCLYQWPAAARDALDALLVQESHKREVHRIGIEYSKDALNAPNDPSVTRLGADIHHTVYKGGGATTRLLGRSEVYGHEAQWLV